MASLVSKPHSSNQLYSFEFIIGQENALSFSQDWKKFDAENASQFNFFQSAEWCLNWLKINPDAEPFIIVSYQGEKPVMVLPMTIHSKYMAKILNIMTGADAEYAGPSFAKNSNEVEIFEQMLIALQSSHLADMLRLNSVLKTSKICNLALPKNQIDAELQYSSVIELSGFDSLDAYFATRSKNTRKSLRRKRKDFAKLGAVEARTVPVTEDFKKEVFPVLCKWKREWFAQHGVLGGNFNSVNMEEQLSALCPTGSEENPALATELRLDGKLVACDIMLQRDKYLYSYVTARDLEFQKYGIGTVMDVATIEYAILNKFKAIDLLSGPNPSKDSLSTMDVSLVDLLFPITEKGKWQAAIDRMGVRGRVKSLFYKLPLSLRQSVIELRH